MQQPTRVTFPYARTITVPRGSYDREIDCEGTYSVNIGGDETDWQIETCNQRLTEYEFDALADRIVDQIGEDIAEWRADQVDGDYDAARDAALEAVS